MAESRFVTDYDVEFWSPPDAAEDDFAAELLAEPDSDEEDDDEPDGDFRFNPGQPRDGEGRWRGDGPDVDLDDDEDEDADPEDEHRNVERFPSRYLQRYGHVTDEVDIGEDGLFVAKTDKGSFHVARGENDRRVLAELDDRKAGALAEFVLLFTERQPDFDVTEPISGVGLRSLGGGGVRLEWPDGLASELSEDGAYALQEALRALGPGFRDEDD
jgi:hypothetical protein